MSGFKTGRRHFAEGTRVQKARDPDELDGAVLLRHFPASLGQTGRRRHFDDGDEFGLGIPLFLRLSDQRGGFARGYAR